MGRPTRRELEDKVDTLRDRLEEAHAIISEALGYDEEVGDGDEPEDDEDGNGED